MFQTFIYWVRTVMKKVFGKATVARAAGADVQVSSDMVSAIELWNELYINTAPWVKDKTYSLELPSTIASELARLVTVEFKSEVSGSARADWLNENYQAAVVDLQAQIEQGMALGGMAFKPYIATDGRLAVDFVPADRFLPTAFDGSRRVTGAVFIDRFTRGKWFYTRFEHHELTGNIYTVSNSAYMSANISTLGVPVPLEQVEPWSKLEDELVLEGVDHPLFGYFRVPSANNTDRDSPLGVSVYAKAVNLIRQADEHWERIMWELEGTELALDISDRAFMPDPKTGRAIVPSKYRRLFRPSALGDADKPLYQVFSPEVRTSSYFDAFNNILRRIEFNCSLAYGTISDPQDVDKTAEEIRSSKQRSYSAVAAMQRALQEALEALVYAMNVWADVGKLAPRGSFEVGFTWGDGVLEDEGKEYARRSGLAQNGWLKPEKLIAWYFGISEEKALKEYMPPPRPPMFPDEPEV